MFEFINKFSSKKHEDLDISKKKSLYPTDPTEICENKNVLDRIGILENKNLILSNKNNHLERELLKYINKYDALLKSSKNEINRIIDARKLLASDSNYRKDLAELGLVSKKEYAEMKELYENTIQKYYDLKNDYEILNRKLNNMLCKDI